MKQTLALLACTFFVASPDARAATVFYTLENVTLVGNTPMKGTFSWNYDVGDFENGVGQFTFLEIPWTSHDHTDLEASFDIGSSIEITLEGNVHDDGVDITLVLAKPLTPTTSSLLVLGPGESKYEIGGNGFHDDLIQSGRISSGFDPKIHSIEFVDALVEIDFTGILQWSSAMLIWEDVDPPPESPYRIAPGADKMYFRGRTR
ncbi:MAG: hypothetical protein ACI9R3_005665 [Verrucomicrobiales bacterium]|jgi:hypothetical protein